MRRVLGCSGCNDTGGTEPLPALRDQPVVWTQGGRTAELATADADPVTGRARVTVRIPAGATPGRATIGFESTERATITVTA